ncbi:MAG: type II secretion system F family protein [Rhodoluna sp.]
MNQIILAATFSLGLWLAIGALVRPRSAALIARLIGQNPQPEFWKVEWNFLRSKVKIRRGGTSQRDFQALTELPDILEMLSVALSSGDSLFAALARVVPMARGLVATELQRTLMALEVGGDLTSELQDFSRRLPQAQVIEFANKVVLAHRRGSPLAQLLINQAKSARDEIRNQLLKQAGKKETLMLLPLVFLILPVTVLFAIYPSLELLNINYS